MNQINKYRIGNQREQYELSEMYLGWVPELMESWDMFYYEYAPGGEYPQLITLVSPTNEKKTLNLHQQLNKDAFPLSFFGEERAEKWGNFLIVSEQDTPEKKFIIPMH